MIDQRRVGLVADRRDQGNGTRRRRPDHALLVERPQVLERAAAARHDQDVRARHRPARRQPIEAFDRRRDLLGRELALDHDRPDQHPAREALGQAVQDVPDHRTRRRSHDPDHFREKRQGALALEREQAFGRELPLPLLEQRHQRPDACRRQAVDDQLIFRAAREGRDPPARDHLEPVLGLEGQALGAAPPADGVQTGARVLEGEIEMPRGRPLEPRDLAAHPDVAVGILERPLERARQLADRELADVALLGETRVRDHDILIGDRWLEGDPAGCRRAVKPGGSVASPRASRPGLANRPDRSIIHGTGGVRIATVRHWLGRFGFSLVLVLLLGRGGAVAQPNPRAAAVAVSGRSPRGRCGRRSSRRERPGRR